MNNTFNKRNPNQQQTSDSIAPNLHKNAVSLDQNTRSGFDLIHRSMAMLTKSEIPNVVEDARVLEVLGDGQKVKYKILTQTPEINYEEGKDGYMEDFLVKARSRNDIGTKTDPEAILNEIKETMSDAQKQEIKRKYLYAVAEHDTLAPLYPSSFFSATPKQGDVIRIYYYNSLMDSGEEIKGFYEIVNQSSYFEKGQDAFLDLLKNFRKNFSDIADKLQNFSLTRNDSSTPEVQNYDGQTTQPTTPIQVPESIQIGDITILPPPSVANLRDTRTPVFSVLAPLPGDTSYRSAELYLRVIKQFGVHGNPRYGGRIETSRKGVSKYDTFCTLFVADVTLAMGTPLPYSKLIESPRLQNKELGEPEIFKTKSRQGYSGWDYYDTPPNLFEDPRNIEEYGAEFMFAWAASPTGRKYGWILVSAEEAQKHADMGFTTVVGGPRIGHIAMVRPSLIINGVKQPFNPKKGPAIAEAGGSVSFNNDEGRYAVESFGGASRGLQYTFYATNKSDKMQVQLTEEQKRNLEQAKLEIEEERRRNGQSSAGQPLADASPVSPDQSLPEEA